MVLGTIRVGHADDQDALTGCTVFIPPEGTTVACEVSGGAPGTRETEILSPMFTVPGANAVVLTGGSAFGLAAANGVMRFLEEKGIGFPTPAGPVPIVSSAVLFDLDLGDPSVRPDEAMGYAACVNASVDEERQGNVGAGTGATVGNVWGRARSTKSGFGLYRFHTERFAIEIAAIPNSFGEVVDDSGRVIGGVRSIEGGFVGAEKLICQTTGLAEGCIRENTTLVLITTNARLRCEEAARIALQGHNGIARAIRPSHTRFDGDTVFVMATNETEAPQDAVEVLAALGTAEAIRSAVLSARPAGGVPSAGDIIEAENKTP